MTRLTVVLPWIPYGLVVAFAISSLFLLVALYSLGIQRRVKPWKQRHASGLIGQRLLIPSAVSMVTVLVIALLGGVVIRLLDWEAFFFPMADPYGLHGVAYLPQEVGEASLTQAQIIGVSFSPVATRTDLEHITLTHMQGAPLYVTLLVTANISTPSLSINLTYNDAPLPVTTAIGAKIPDVVILQIVSEASFDVGNYTMMLYHEDTLVDTIELSIVEN
ncbi:MAG: hypothetical protein ACOYLB_10645 [Phototrophicaceae bacterium]